MQVHPICGARGRPVQCLLPLLLSVFLAACLTTPATANPLPAAFVFVHVQPWDPDWCVTNPITECSQMVQYSEVEGDVEFDLYIHEWMLHWDLDSFEFETVLPEGWSYSEFEPCLSGDWLEWITTDGTIISMQVDPPVPPTGEAILLGRLRINVSGPGRLEFPYFVYAGEESPVSHAWAGIGPCWCATDCSEFTDACGVHYDNPVLELEVRQGEQVDGVISGHIGWHGEMPCPVTFVPTEEWMTLEVAYPNPEVPSEVEVTVTVDATDLPTGLHTGLVRGVAVCSDCATVVVDVLEPLPVGEDDPQVVHGSWGRVKQRYR